MALFGEKYEDDVRVVRMGDYSTELWRYSRQAPGISASSRSSPSGIAAGVRIEAVTGKGAIDFMHQLGEQIEEAAALVKGSVLHRRQVRGAGQAKMMERELEQLKAAGAQAGKRPAESGHRDQWPEGAGRGAGRVDPKSLRGMLDELKIDEVGVVLLANQRRRQGQPDRRRDQ